MEVRSSDVLLIGGGPSALLTALTLPEERKVLLLEKTSKRNFTLGKRILVSGNGRCNFFNEDLLDPEFYQEHQELSFLNPDIAKEFLNYLEKDLGFAYRKEGKLYYPFFNRSECFLSCLLEGLKRRKNFEVYPLEAKRWDREKKRIVAIDIEEKEVSLSYNDLYVAIGGRSLDRPTFPMALFPKEVSFHPFSPLLCPVSVKEKIPSYLKNNRLKGRLSLFAGKKLLAYEDGEVLFKEDGLSGIALFNLTLPLTQAIEKGGKDFTFSLDYTLVEGKKLKEDTSFSCYPQFLKEYLKEKHLKRGEPLSFTFASLYPFKDSQVTYGGFPLSLLNYPSFSYQEDPSYHVLGETLDLAFPCGGYNMGVSLLEGYLAGKNGRKEGTV